MNDKSDRRQSNFTAAHGSFSRIGQVVPSNPRFLGPHEHKSVSKRHLESRSVQPFFARLIGVVTNTERTTSV